MTVYRGISHPDEEPRIYEVREKRRQFGFDKETAANARFGDLYLQMNAPAAKRFYVELRAGEHGLDEDALACVTHRFEPRWKGADEGKWVPYDTVQNLVIRVDEPENYAVYRALESALYQTPLGRAVGQDALRPLVQAACEVLGADMYKDYQESEHRFTVDTEKNAVVRKALQDVLDWAPENGYWEQLGEIGAEADGVGFAKDANGYADLINGRSDGFDGEGDGRPLPMLSQPVYYAVAGSKDDGRSFKSRLEYLKQVVGLEDS